MREKKNVVLRSERVGITGGGIFGQELIIRPRLLRAKNKFLGHRGLSALLWTVDTFVFGFERSQGQFDGGRRSQSVLLFSRKNFLFCFKASKLSSVSCAAVM